MINFELKNNVSDANASGRGLSSAPWINYNKSDYVMSEVQNVRAQRKACNQVTEAQVFNSINKESKLVQEGVWQSGRSMIEMLGVLAIIGVLSVGGIAGYSKAMMKYRINKSIEQITLISGNIRTFFSPQKDYSGLDETVIKKAKLVPDEMWDGNSIKNIFDGNVVISNINSFHGKFFYIQYEGLPQEACIELSTLDWVSNITELSSMAAYDESNKGDFSPRDMFVACDSGIVLDGVTFVSPCDREELPIKMENAVKGCSCTSNECGIYWGFSK